MWRIADSGVFRFRKQEGLELPISSWRWLEACRYGYVGEQGWCRQAQAALKGNLGESRSVRVRLVYESLYLRKYLVFFRVKIASRIRSGFVSFSGYKYVPPTIVSVCTRQNTQKLYYFRIYFSATSPPFFFLLASWSRTTHVRATWLLVCFYRVFFEL
jgi:hypothetical protein